MAAACGGSDESGDSGGGTEVAVAGTDTACTPARTELAAGRTTFVFTNSAKQVSEIYVLDPAGKVVKEVENVPTGYEVRHLGDPRRRTNRVESDVMGLLSECFFVKVMPWLLGIGLNLLNS